MAGSVRSMGLNKNKKMKKPGSKQQITKRGRGSLSSHVKELVNYLKSDSFLYSELISSSDSVDPLPLSTPDIIGIEGRNKMKTREELKQYLESDTYMYAPLINLVTHPPPSRPPPPEDRGNLVKVRKGRWSNLHATTKEIQRKTRRRKIL